MGSPRAFRLAYVFDVSQTDGNELPEPPCYRLEGDAPAGAYSELVEVAAAIGFTVDDEELPGEVNGYCIHGERRIAVEVRNKPPQRVKTLAHELAHALLHEAPGGPRELNELEAESVAYVVCQELGIDSGAYSFGYVATWAAGGEEALRGINASGQRIKGAAHRILHELEAVRARRQALPTSAAAEPPKRVSFQPAFSRKESAMRRLPRFLPMVLVAAAPSFAVGLGAGATTSQAQPDRLRQNGLIAYLHGPRFTSTLDTTLWIMRGDGSNKRKLLGQDVCQCASENPVWAADGSWIIFARFARPSRTVKNPELWKIRPNGTGLRRVTPRGWGRQQPEMSPDGRWVASRKSLRSGIYLLDLRTGRERARPYGRRTGEADTPMSWSPDSRFLLFFRFSESHPERTGLWIGTRAGRSKTKLNGTGDQGTNAQWSPDGRWIVYGHQVGPPPGLPGKITRHQRLVSARGGSPKALPAPPGTDWSNEAWWSPDGTKLLITAGRAYGQTDRSPGFALYSLRIKDRRARRLTDPPAVTGDGPAGWGPAPVR